MRRGEILLRDAQRVDALARSGLLGEQALPQRPQIEHVRRQLSQKPGRFRLQRCPPIGRARIPSVSGPDVDELPAVHLDAATAAELDDQRIGALCAASEVADRQAALVPQLDGCAGTEQAVGGRRNRMEEDGATRRAERRPRAEDVRRRPGGRHEQPGGDEEVHHRTNPKPHILKLTAGVVVFS